MSGVVRLSATATQYHVQVTTRSGQNKARLIEVNTATNTFNLSNLSNGKATIAREFDLRNLNKFERLENEVFLRLYFVSPAVSCDLSFPDLDSLDDFLTTVKDFNPNVLDEVVDDQEGQQQQDDDSQSLQPSPSQQQQQPSQSQNTLPQQADISQDVNQTSQQQQLSEAPDQKKSVKKWHELMDKYGPGPNDGYKAYVRQGIPPTIRAEVWMCLSDLHSFKKQSGLGYYQSLINLAQNAQYADVNRAIDQGLNLSDPKNAKNENLHRVCRILRAYNVRNMNAGYSQQLIFISALLISVLDEENSFWMLVWFVESLCCVDISNTASNTTLQGSKRAQLNATQSTRPIEKEKDLLTSHLFYYHHTDQLGLQIDQAVFASLLQDKLPKVAAKLQQLAIPIPPLTSRWFTAILIHTLRSDIVLRIWDCILFDGVKSLFRAYLTIFKWNEKAILKCSTRNEFIAALQEFATNPINTNAFIDQMYAMWLRSFSISDIVHYRRLHAKVLISEIETTKEIPTPAGTPTSASSASSHLRIDPPSNNSSTEIVSTPLSVVRDTSKPVVAVAVATPAPVTTVPTSPTPNQSPRSTTAKNLSNSTDEATEYIPSQTQSASVSEIIRSKKHNHLFVTQSSQQAAPAIIIFGERRGFTPHQADLYADGEIMSDYTDDEEEIVAPPPPIPEEEFVPPPPQENDFAPPPPPDDSQITITNSLPPSTIEVEDFLPPPVSMDNTEEDTLSTSPKQATREWTAPAANGFRRPTRVGETAPGPIPLTPRAAIAEPAQLVAVQDDEDTYDAPPSAEEMAKRKAQRDEQILSKARQIALQGAQRQNISAVMASIELPSDNKSNEPADLVVPDSSDDENEIAEQEEEIARIKDEEENKRYEEQLPPNAADDSDDDEMIGPAGVSTMLHTTIPAQQEEPKQQIDQAQTELPPPVVEDDVTADAALFVEKQQPVAALDEPAPVAPVAPVVEEQKPSFRRPLFKMKSELEQKRQRSASKTAEEVPETQPHYQQEQQEQQPPAQVPTPGEPHIEQQQLEQAPVEEQPVENKSKAIMQRALLTKNRKQNATLPRGPLPTPPAEAPPSMSLPVPPPPEEEPQYVEQQQQQTQEAVFWPTEPVTQSTYNNGYVDPLASFTNAVGPIVDPARRCVKCSQQIYSNALFANNLLYHQQCFSCTTCHCPLSGVPYYTHNGNVYCQQDYAIAKGYVCIYCKQAVAEGLTLGMNDYAHFECVHCATCHQRPSPHELQRLASGQSCIANPSTYHLHKQPHYQHVNKALYYQFLCNPHFVQQRQQQLQSQPQAQFYSPSHATAPSPSPSHNAQTHFQPPPVDPNVPCCYRCDQPLDVEITKVQGQQYHKSCLVCPLCNIYVAQAVKKPQGVLFSQKKKGTFYCCEHTNDTRQNCKACFEPLLLEPSCPQHASQFHSYCGGSAHPSIVIPSTPTNAPRQPSTPLPATPSQAPKPVASLPAPTTPATPRTQPCTVCQVADPTLPSVAIRGKPIHKQCLQCVTCHTTMGTDILKTFPAMMYSTIFRNFTVRQPDFAEQDPYYANHYMAPTHECEDLPVGLICTYCYDAYVKNQ